MDTAHSITLINTTIHGIHNAMDRILRFEKFFEIESRQNKGVTPKYRQIVTIIHLVSACLELKKTIFKRPYLPARLCLSIWHVFRSFLCKL